MPDTVDHDPVELAMTWFLAARAMVSARRDDERAHEAAAGLYAQAILHIPESVCLEAKQPERIGVRTLVDCLSSIKRLPAELAEGIIVGVLMIAYSDGRMHPLEVRWASMVTSAAELSQDEFQRCCASARVIAAMLRPRDAGAGS